MKRKIVIGAFALLCTITLTACGKSEKHSEKASVFSPEKQEQKSYSFYQDAKTNSRIYYQVSLPEKVSFGREAQILGIIYVEHGKYTYYNTSDVSDENLNLKSETHTLGELKGKSDKEILKLAVQWDKQVNIAYSKKLEEEAQDILNSNSQPLSGQEEINRLDEIKAAKKNIYMAKNFEYSEPKPKKLEVFVKEDASGNNVGEEMIALPAYGSQVKFILRLPKNALEATDEVTEVNETNAYFCGDYKYADNLKYYDISPTQDSGVVYDKTYSIGNFGKSILATQGTSIMKLDSLSEKGILDYSEPETQYNVVKEAGWDFDIAIRNVITWK